VTADGVDGVDITVPVYQFSETHYFSDAQVNASYNGAIFSCTGKTNAGGFKGFAPGEVLFLGASGSKRGDSPDDDWEITFQFAASPNETGLSLGSITGINKDGWEYLWVRYADAEDTGQPLGLHIGIDTNYNPAFGGRMSTLQQRHEKLVVWIVAGTALLQAVVVGVAIVYSDLPALATGASTATGGTAPPAGATTAPVLVLPPDNPLGTTHFWSVVLGVPLLTPLAAIGIAYFRKSGWRLLSPDYDYAGKWTFRDKLLITRPGAMNVEEVDVEGTMVIRQSAFGIRLAFEMGSIDGPHGMTSTQLAAQLSDDGQSIFMLHQITTDPAKKVTLSRDGWCAERIRRFHAGNGEPRAEDDLGRPLRLQGDFVDTADFNRARCVGSCIYERCDERPPAAWLPRWLRRILAGLGEWLS